jgi:hypothetical protein
MPKRGDYVLDGVTVRECAAVHAIEKPVFTSGNWQVNQNEYSAKVEGVGSFYVRDGREVDFSVEPGVDRGWASLYLNNQVLVALLHQRKIISFHASSFVYDGRGVMITGETGAGKTSLTASFVMSGAGFLTDDLTPVIFSKSGPGILTLNRDIKLRTNTVDQLKIDTGRLTDAETGTGKKYLKIKHKEVSDHPLHVILKIETGSVSKPEFQPLPAAEKFAVLRSEVCSWEMLAGMPETEAAYLHQLLEIVRQTVIVKVVRPADITIADFHSAIERFLNNVEG